MLPYHSFQILELAAPDINRTLCRTENPRVCQRPHVRDTRVPREHAVYFSTRVPLTLVPQLHSGFPVLDIFWFSGIRYFLYFLEGNYDFLSKKSQKCRHNNVIMTSQ